MECTCAFEPLGCCFYGRICSRSGLSGWLHENNVFRSLDLPHAAQVLSPVQALFFNAELNRCDFGTSEVELPASLPFLLKDACATMPWLESWGLVFCKYTEDTLLMGMYHNRTLGKFSFCKNEDIRPLPSTSSVFQAFLTVSKAVILRNMA